MSQDTTESPIFDGDPSRPPINNLEEIRSLRGASAEPRPIEDIQSVMNETSMAVVLNEATRTVLDRPEETGNTENDERGEANALSFLRRIRTCLDILAEEDALLGGTFSFADVVFLAGRSVERTLERALQDGKIEETEYADLREELLFVAPEICAAFNSAVAVQNLPRQRQHWHAIGSALPVQQPATE